MSLIPKIYDSADSGAPVLNGTAGSMVALLDALLVDGYGAGISAKPGLGWTRTYSATNKRVFRNSPVSGTGYYLRIDDSATYAAQVTGFESMSDIDNGANKFPLAANFATGASWPKSTSTLPATARTWWAIGTENCLYLVHNLSSTTQAVTDQTVHFAGDIKSHAAVDPYRFMIACHGTMASYAGSGTVNHYLFNGVDPGASSITSTPGLVGARSADGIDVGRYHRALFAGECANDAWGGNAYISPYPDPVSGGILYTRGRILQATRQPRGYFPGLYVPLHPATRSTWSDKQILSAIPNMPVGTSWLYKFVNSTAGGAALGGVFFDITNEW